MYNTLQRFLVAAVLCIFFLQSCHSPDLPGSADYTFINRGSKRLTMDFYASKADYGANRNRLEQHLLGPGDSLKGTYPIGHTYWLDWYSDDFTTNNMELGNNHSTPGPEFNIAEGNARINLVYAPMKDTLRSVLLKGMDAQSVWASAQSAGERYVFTIRKDGTVHVKYTADNGAVSDNEYTWGTNSITSDQYGIYRFGIFISGETSQFTYLLNWDLRNTGRDVATLSGNTAFATMYRQ